MSKLINVSDKVYQKLTHLKGKESYTIVIEKLIERKTNKNQILAHFGKFSIDEQKVNEAQEFVRKWSKKYV